MFFKNTTTGVTWEVIDEDQIKRCQNDSDYEEVKTPSKKESNKKQSPKKEGE